MDAIIPSSPGARLRALLNQPGILITPGVYDGFSLRLVEAMGYKSAAISGAGLSESNLGWSDVGIMGYAENLRASAAARIFSTASSAEMTRLPSMWPQRFGHTWSSIIRQARPARSNPWTVK